MNKVSYALGLSIASQFKASGIRNISVNELARAIGDVMSDKKTEISYEEASEIVKNLFNEISSEEKIKNLKEGKEYLEKIKKRSSAIVLQSGVVYEILKEGSGPRPKKTDTVRVHYEGSLINGTVFDSSKRRGEPASFPVTAVIKGWTEILQLMPVGSVWKVFIPSDLAYGEHGAGELIRPNSTLIFEIELLKIED